jgi:ketosteroid isomerase-like protein
MNRDAQIALVARYFQAVDAKDLPTILDTLSEGCVFTVETHGVRLEGREAISGMFERLWINHRAVRHHKFVYVTDPEHGRVAVRFQVENTETDGSLTHKSNCNFFEIEDGRFSAVAVYMAGPNTLDAKG